MARLGLAYLGLAWLGQRPEAEPGTALAMNHIAVALASARFTSSSTPTSTSASALWFTPQPKAILVPIRADSQCPYTPHTSPPSPSMKDMAKKLEWHKHRESLPHFCDISLLCLSALNVQHFFAITTLSWCTAPPQPLQLWATLTKQEERIVELMQEGNDDEIDELAGDEGKLKPWHPPCLHLSSLP
ncbi:hypothetical protein F5888DRAFT_1811954 [Russula emetica]|nr:hypothetical protein F5888DRAFT_1811954 [Russula emetica]